MCLCRFVEHFSNTFFNRTHIEPNKNRKRKTLPPPSWCIYTGSAQFKFLFIFFSRYSRKYILLYLFFCDFFFFRFLLPSFFVFISVCSLKRNFYQIKMNIEYLTGLFSTLLFCSLCASVCAMFESVFCSFHNTTNTTIIIIICRRREKKIIIIIITLCALYIVFF